MTAHFSLNGIPATTDQHYDSKATLLAETLLYAKTNSRKTDPFSLTFSDSFVVSHNRNMEI